MIFGYISPAGKPKYYLPYRVVAAYNASDESKKKAHYVCDGTDDQVEIQQAISDLPSQGGIIYLTEGDFNIHDTLTIDKSVTFVGSGQYSTTIHTRKTDDSSISVQSPTEFSNLKFDFHGERVYQISNSSTLTIRRAYFYLRKRCYGIKGGTVHITDSYINYYATDYAVTFVNSSTVIFTNNKVYADCGGYIVVLNVTDKGIITNNEVHLATSYKDNFVSGGSTDAQIVIEGNIMYGWRARMYYGNCEYCIISDNFSINNRIESLYLSEGTYYVFNNYFSNKIYLKSWTKATICNTKFAGFDGDLRGLKVIGPIL